MTVTYNQHKQKKKHFSFSFSLSLYFGNILPKCPFSIPKTYPTSACHVSMPKVYLGFIAVLYKNSLLWVKKMEEMCKVNPLLITPGICMLMQYHNN